MMVMVWARRLVIVGKWSCGSAGRSVTMWLPRCTTPPVPPCRCCSAGWWDSTSMVVLTNGAVGLAGEDVSDLAAAAVWGLVRSAQAEHPAGSCCSTPTPTRCRMRRFWSALENPNCWCGPVRYMLPG